MRCTLFLSAIAVVAHAAGAEPVTSISWKFHAVGTPEFPDEPRIGKPGYVEPVPIDVKLPSEVACPSRMAWGEFEAYVNGQGVVETVHSRYEPIEGNSCQRIYILPVIKSWRFAPAIFDGKPTPVFMWVGVSSK